MAGLLTCFVYKLPSRDFPIGESVVYNFLYETYSSGTVQDLHLIPF